jgi:hypothetical protein
MANNENDFETLYNNLKEEYEQSKKDNDEIFKEYESTIQLLTDSVEALKKEKKEFQTKFSKFENEQKSLKREKDNLIKKNKDKQIDIQCLNEQNDKLNELIKKLKEDKSIFDTKIVTLENDIDHYQNKVREYEDFIDELKSQLEEALEENITLQTEFETYKLNTGDQLIRKEEELRDIRNDISNKEKLIQRLSKKPSERFNIPKLQQKLIKDKKFMRYQRRYTISENKADFETEFNNIGKKLKNIEENENENNDENEANDIKDNIKTYKKLRTIAEDNYKKMLTTCKTSEKLENNANDNNKNNNDNVGQSSQKNMTKISKLDMNKEEENNKDKNDSKKNNDLGGLTSIIQRQFPDLVICEENKLYLNPLVQKLLTKEQIKEFKISLQNMLIRIKQRINNLKTCKKTINERLEKIGFRAK